LLSPSYNKKRRQFLKKHEKKQKVSKKTKLIVESIKNENSLIYLGLLIKSVCFFRTPYLLDLNFFNLIELDL